MTDKRFGDIIMLSDFDEPGAIILRLDNPTFDEMLSGLRRVLDTYDEHEIWRAIVVVEPDKLRRHSLR